MKEYLKFFLGYGVALGAMFAVLVFQSHGQTQVFDRTNLDPPDLPLAVGDLTGNIILNSSLNSYLSTIASEESATLASKGKYKSGKYNLFGVTVELHEYITAKDEKGYQVIFRAVSRNVPVTKSIGYGVEAKDRTWDWR